MEPISAWTATAKVDLDSGIRIFGKKVQEYTLQFFTTDTSLWITASWPKAGALGFRPVFAANDKLTVKKFEDNGDSIEVLMEGLTGKYHSVVSFPDTDKAIFRYTTSFTPALDLMLPFWPRDIIPVTKTGSIENTAGRVHVRQAGTRSGQLFISMTRPKTGSVFYFQNLSALSGYCEATETSAGDCVGGEWPEVGFRLPATKDKPLPAGKEVVISDAFVLLSEVIPEDDFGITQQYLNYLAEVYLLLPKPETEYHDWPGILKKGLNDLSNHKGCWKYVNGNAYLNAYVSDYETPPEIMVQLAVLMPLIDYDKWSGEDHDSVINTLKQGLPDFYDKHLGTIVRWHPAWHDRLDKDEEQKSPEIMDSWYLHHPLMNLTRLAIDGDKEAEKLIMESIGYVIKVAHEFDYEWPVFYKMATLEVVKAETAEGQGGEMDVPGAYAHLMLQVWQLTGEEKYLNEAKRAAKKLKGLGFSLFYQANNTAFSAGAMLRLYKETGDELYLNLSYSCIAAIMRNVQLWDWNYGYGKNFPPFFAVYPLNDAPYIAAYEEQEVFAGIHNYLKEAEDVELLPSVRLLLAEFVRYAVHRLLYFYPPMLPEEMLSDEVKTGEIDPGLWIALEDMQDGWNKSGQVGQEVYGAGISFGIVPRQYFRIKDTGLMVFSDYPVRGFRKSGKNAATLKVYGDERLTCRLVIVYPEGKKRVKIKVSTGSGKAARELSPVSSAAKNEAYTINGNSSIKLQWQ